MELTDANLILSTRFHTLIQCNRETIVSSNQDYKHRNSILAEYRKLKQKTNVWPLEHLP
jgi:hypothetical protein